MTHVVCTDDGRRLSVEEMGKSDGDPVFLLHGTPGSRIGPHPRISVLYWLGVRLITFDRPGYGGSDRQVGRSVGSVAGDVSAIADHLGLDRFSVVGRSGGGPHALACAALLPERVLRVAVLVGLAPHAAEGLDWFGGMTPSNVTEYTVALSGRHRFADWLAPAAREIRADPASLIAGLYAELPEADRRMVNNPGVRDMLLRNYAEALRRSEDGWVDDAIAFCSPWGFDPADITVPTLLWHGGQDRFSPIDHSRWLATRIRTATMWEEPEAAHFGALAALPDLLPWLVNGEDAA
ncbi:alpha/beta hydrolase [Sphaerisporangium rufum]|uniref:Alpha/beta hydrolase n=1 Tax=Sphaerisporangium rufum TaxID=1381558 RepID=A0A919QZA2_9ACTN|nr:alpha/beta hydrolase [Sphaerisporangium rufum]GII76742.1 alpha/beta hydrolase [Sphaerisporangium rufum]